MQKKSSFIAPLRAGHGAWRLRRLGKEPVRNSGIGARHRALDVACGTGIVARPTADRVAPSSSVVGLDAHAAMLTVARAKNDAGTVQTGKKRSISKITNAQQAQMVSIK
jgi:2-polyprenyl-3-methyl-5-hydroxy-6-metoxy-1,4-benzoquinol methylase